jgi:hypothetical protein
MHATYASPARRAGQLCSLVPEAAGGRRVVHMHVATAAVAVVWSMHVLDSELFARKLLLLIMEARGGANSEKALCYTVPGASARRGSA